MDKVDAPNSAQYATVANSCEQQTARRCGCITERSFSCTSRNTESVPSNAGRKLVTMSSYGEDQFHWLQKQFGYSVPPAQATNIHWQENKSHAYSWTWNVFFPPVNPYTKQWLNLAISFTHRRHFFFFFFLMNHSFFLWYLPKSNVLGYFVQAGFFLTIMTSELEWILSLKMLLMPASLSKLVSDLVLKFWEEEGGRR